MGTGTHCFLYQWAQLQIYESRTLFLMTSLQYYCILGPTEIKTLHLDSKLCTNDAGWAGNKITVDITWLMVDIMRTVVVFYINYNPASCHRVRLNMSMTSTEVLFNPIFNFLFKTHSAKANLPFIKLLKHDNKLASQCTSTMDDLNYCVLDNSYTAVYVFTNQKCAELQIASARFSLLYRLNLSITSIIASYHWISTLLSRTWDWAV